MESVPDSTTDVREEVFGSHAHNEAPLFQELWYSARIPPVQVKHAVTYARDLGQCCDYIIHNHVVESHVNVESKRHQLKDQGHKGQIGLTTGRLNELHNQDVVHQQSQEGDQ